MRLDDFKPSGNVEDRRGMGGGGGMGGIGRGGIGLGGLAVVLLISYFTGINPAVLIGGYESVTGGNEEQVEQPSRTGAPADESGQFVDRVLGSTQETWTEIFKERGANYKAPRLVLFSGGTTSQCGQAQSAMGPFYCPLDQKVYLDTEFFDEMRQRFKACPTGEGQCAFAQAYVIAHEIGHHVQNLIGVLPKVNERRQQSDPTTSNRLSVQTELQADCFAGVWANRTQQRYKFIEAGDVEGALQTAQAIGDDMLQRRSQGRVVPD